jgi:hypothetical protein
VERYRKELQERGDYVDRAALGVALPRILLWEMNTSRPWLAEAPDESGTICVGRFSVSAALS